jgi:Cu-Zn family superoxide dismutase
MLNLISGALLTFMPFLAVATSASSMTDQTTPNPQKKISEGAIFAHAVIEPKSNSQVKGNVYFTQLKDGVLVLAEIDNLTPGDHGFHVHEFGDCSAPDASTVGGHFNPTHHKHGGPDDPDRHLGDLGNITADSNGHAYFMRVDKVMSLNGANSIIGHAIIVHADKDDFVSQPAGNSGKKIGCGKIEEVVID